MRGLLWFREDLRLHDHPALLQLAEHCDELILVYCFDDGKLDTGAYRAKGIGAPRLAFLRESLDELAASIARLGQRLIIRRGAPVEILSQLIRRYAIDCLGLTVSLRERQSVRQICQRFPRLKLVESWAHTLYDPSQLPVTPQAMPNDFEEFGRLVADIPPGAPEPAPDVLPPPPMIAWTEECDPLPDLQNPYCHEWVPPLWFGFRGGEQAALCQLRFYLWDRHLIRRYESTCNRLSGWESSSKLSPWLSNGCLSVRRVWQAVREYEAFCGACDSTRRLRRELLWREFFQWLLLKYEGRPFEPAGPQGRRRLLGFYPEAYLAWTQGRTGIPIVDACMRELRTTGWLSNRGRRISAQFLVDELAIDWRFGAAWFEQQLIDFDPALNWGNWNYFACAEPLRMPQDSILQQARRYDPEAEYISLWLPELKELARDQRHTPFWSRRAADFRSPIVDISPWRDAL